MMLRIAEAPEWDKVNEGKTLTPYHTSELLNIELELLLSLTRKFIHYRGYLLEVLK